MSAAAPAAPTNPADQGNISRPPPGVALPAAAATVNIRYLESAAIRVQGPATRRHYEFSGVSPVQPVLAQDAVHFLRTRLFRQG